MPFNESKILSTLKEIEAHNKIINDLTIQIRKELGPVSAPAPTGGLPDSEKAKLRRKLYKTSLKSA